MLIMKKIYFALLVLFAALTVVSCDKYDDGIPSHSIRKDFSAKYPDARDVEWDREGPYWVVSFETGVWPDVVEYEVWYDSAGEVVEEKRDR